MQKPGDYKGCTCHARQQLFFLSPIMPMLPHYFPSELSNRSHRTTTKSDDSKGKGNGKGKDGRGDKKRTSEVVILPDDNTSKKARQICGFWVASGSCSKGTDCKNDHRQFTKDDYAELKRFANTKFRAPEARAAAAKVLGMLPTVQTS